MKDSLYRCDFDMLCHVRHVLFLMAGTKFNIRAENKGFKICCSNQQLHVFDGFHVKFFTRLSVKAFEEVVSGRATFQLRQMTIVCSQ